MCGKEMQAATTNITNWRNPVFWRPSNFRRKNRYIIHYLKISKKPGFEPDLIKGEMIPMSKKLVLKFSWLVTLALLFSMLSPIVSLAAESSQFYYIEKDGTVKGFVYTKDPHQVKVDIEYKDATQNKSNIESDKPRFGPGLFNGSCIGGSTSSKLFAGIGTCSDKSSDTLSKLTQPIDGNNYGYIFTQFNVPELPSKVKVHIDDQTTVIDHIYQPDAEPSDSNTPAPIEANSFSDLTTSHWAYNAVNWSVNNHVVSGYPDGTFKPDQNVTQSELLAMLLKAYKTSVAQPAEGKSWDADYINYARENNWTLLDDTGNSINRGQIATLLTNAAGHNYDFNDSIQYLLDSGLSNGKTSPTVEGYQAADLLTRAEAITFIRMVTVNLNTLKKAPNVKENYVGSSETVKNAEYVGKWGIALAIDSDKKEWDERITNTFQIEVAGGNKLKLSHGDLYNSRVFYDEKGFPKDQSSSPYNWESKPFEVSNGAADIAITVENAPDKEVSAHIEMKNNQIVITTKENEKLLYFNQSPPFARTE
jgi:hypothetical protein